MPSSWADVTKELVLDKGFSLISGMFFKNVNVLT